jgi:hypothetical protein
LPRSRPFAPIRNSGKALAERLEPGNAEQLRDGRRPSHDDVAARRAAQVGELVARAVHLQQDAARVLQQALACVGRRDPPAIAIQQGLLELDFEPAHPRAERRLRDRQQRSGLAEAAELRYVHEIVELPQIHAPSPPFRWYLENS